MSVEQIKEVLSHLSIAEQDELSAFLFHLRHRGDDAYKATVNARIADKDSSHWLTPEELERRLDTQ